MNSHFEDGVRAGLKSGHPQGVPHFARCSDDYKRGYILGYCYQVEELWGEKDLAAWQAGVLTRQYQLDKEVMMEFFTDFRSERFAQSFAKGYQKPVAQTPLPAVHINVN